MSTDDGSADHGVGMDRAAWVLGDIVTHRGLRIVRCRSGGGWLALAVRPDRGHSSQESERNVASSSAEQYHEWYKLGVPGQSFPGGFSVVHEWRIHPDLSGALREVLPVKKRFRDMGAEQQQLETR